ncbi:putative orfan [Tupanvirus soda lake]|uniref:E3 ubiquitin-protein ligase LAP n=2 Tax=Tupanvirus TaxID=2094720 RepID=A0A6N1NRR2_9VIRU|nr:putative orfan [Tupanvirus soda lake]QKU35227.1 putative orfan [Tupanvirus soda lake]
MKETPSAHDVTDKSPTPSSRNSLELDHCKYCLQNPIENTSKFVKPCKCTNPVCVSCLKRQLELKRVTKCEICVSEINITDEMGIDLDALNTSISRTESATTIQSNETEQENESIQPSQSNESVYNSRNSISVVRDDFVVDVNEDGDTVVQHTYSRPVIWNEYSDTQHTNAQTKHYKQPCCDYDECTKVCSCCVITGIIALILLAIFGVI